MSDKERKVQNDTGNEKSSLPGGQQQAEDTTDDGLKSAEELEQAAKLVDAMEQPDSFEY
ncbi:hypothetical protein KIH86_28465 [Paenibacillus sp. HN-1]|uniref:hypothetical protein n=1 Tax=Paenibacillus TaxID=44249 RepID=UPI001CA95AD3|nr:MULTISPECIES: hypothetical protein [Paenibacillus]MBY9081836.1 hypothetical protein [Paenibacillus sp. CGMCC 1.18879]MBY9088127.1 hypothetical protein [Paenibacillus sinensis]